MSKKDLYQKYVQWKAKPKDERILKTAKAFANHYELTAEDLSDFVSRPEFKDDLTQATLKWALLETPKLLHTMYARLQSSSAKPSDMQAWLQILKQVDVTTGILKFNFEDQLSLKQLKEIATIVNSLIKNYKK